MAHITLTRMLPLQEVVQVGVIQGGDTMQALLRLMSTLYAPQFITGSLWPESIKKDFIGMLLHCTHECCPFALFAMFRLCVCCLYLPVASAYCSLAGTCLFDCTGQLHKFLARLTETSHGLKGRTVLYLPQGNMADPIAAAADKVLHPASSQQTPCVPLTK